MKIVESTVGTVTMADGTPRAAYSNTYKVFTETGTELVTRIEFELFTNACNGGRKYRKVSDKQEATFTV